MKNDIECSNCGTQNPFYKLNCNNCKAFIRTRIVNIDLWSTISHIIETPVKAFQNIIQAEHKNFIFLLTFLTGIKLYLFAVMGNSFVDPHNGIVDYFILNMLIFLVYTGVLISVASFIITRLNQSFGLSNRFKDNYAIYVYSLLPILLSLVILSPVHYALFGKFWFTYNPSPFIVKPAVAWVMSIIEVILLIWSIMMSIVATYAQTQNKSYSILIGVSFWLLIGVALFFAPLLPFV